MLAAQWEFAFQVCWGGVVLGNSMPDVASASVSVVAHALLKGDLLLSDAVDNPLLEFVSDPEPASEPKTSSATARPSSATAAQPFVAHRWMRKYLDKPKPDPETFRGQ